VAHDREIAILDGFLDMREGFRGMFFNQAGGFFIVRSCEGDTHEIIVTQGRKRTSESLSLFGIFELCSL